MAMTQLTKTAANCLWILQAGANYCKSLLTSVAQATELRPFRSLSWHFFPSLFCEQNIKPHTSLIA